ncbi:hypothetical protein GCM10010250_22400 [Streptomyces althioticus]|uniref:hypothetical protein n=1 Tax=Streptomyces althioticus TaxID=83380 RepID=UPI0018758C6D|nr:hypothetical protein GCM10010250_22400 [Streptomyces althioticus]
MAIRGTPARRVVGNPLAGVLRGLDQRTRVAARTRVTGAREEDPVPPASARVAQPVGPAAAVVTTGEDGRVQWVFPAPFAAAPAVSAVAVDPEPGDDERTVWAVVEEVTSWCLVVRAWRTRPRRGVGVAEPCGPGVRVHVTATAAGGG